MARNFEATAGMQTPGERDLSEALGRIARLADSERMRDIDALEQLWDCKQYAGRASFWDKSTPLQSREPCVKDPVVRIAGTRLASMIFGEKMFPKITPVAGETGIGSLQLLPEEAAVLSDVITAIINSGEMRAVMRALCRDGLKSRTAVSVGRLRAGVPAVDSLPAKHCKPTFDPLDNTRVVKLEYRYRYPDPENDGKACWYRRVITETSDTVWDRVPARDDGRDPDWSAYPSVAIPVEFCAVGWHPNLPDTTCHHDHDGVALAEGLGGEVEALDFARSMKHRNALYNGDPQFFAGGVEPGDLTSGDDGGGAPRGMALGSGTAGNGATPENYAPSDPGGLKKGAGTIWYARDPQAKVSMLESDGSGANILGADVQDLRRLIQEALNIVIADPEKLGTGDLSARALMILFRAMLDFGDNLRACWGRALRQVIGIQLRLIAGGQAARDGVFIPGAVQARAILQRFYLPTRNGRRWFDPPLELTWPQWFDPSNQEILQLVQAAVLATGNQQVLTTRTAVQLLQHVAPITSVDSEVAEIQKETSAHAAILQKTMGALGENPERPPHMEPPRQ